MEIMQNNVTFKSIIITKKGHKYVDNMIKNGTTLSEIHNIVREHSKNKRANIYITESGPVVHDNLFGKVYTPTGKKLSGNINPIMPDTQIPIEYELAQGSSAQFTKKDLERASKYNSDFLLTPQPTYIKEKENSYLSYLGNDMRAKLSDDKMNAALDITNDLMRNNRLW